MADDLVGHFEASAAPEGPETWYHLTDNPRFALNAEHEPEDNSFSMDDRSGQKGVYLGKDPSHWFSAAAEGYARPYLAEFRVHPSVKDAPGVHGRWGGEMFVPAHHFDKLHLHRVIPTDAYVREHYGSHGWIEEHHGSEFDTRGPLRQNPDNRHYPFSPKWNDPSAYQYPGPDVRDMAPEEHDWHRDRWLSYLKGDRGFSDEDVAGFREQHDSHHEAARRPGRGENACACCKGEGAHPDGSECDPCDGFGLVHSGEPDVFCPGQPRPRRRHWRQGSPRKEGAMSTGGYDFLGGFPRSHKQPHHALSDAVLSAAGTGRVMFVHPEGSGDDRRFIVGDQPHAWRAHFRVNPEGEWSSHSNGRHRRLGDKPSPRDFSVISNEPAEEDGESWADASDSPGFTAARDQKKIRAEAASMIDLYHHTSPEAAAKIYRERRMTSKENTGSIFFTTDPESEYAAGFGDGVVHVRMPRAYLDALSTEGTSGKAWQDDEFPSGEQHWAIHHTALRPEHFIDPGVGIREGAGPEDYGMDHRPDVNGPPLHDLLDSSDGDWGMPKDIYERMREYNLYSHDDGLLGEAAQKAMGKIRKFRGQPEKKVRIWRSAPAQNPESRNAKHGEINHGDWIGLSREKALSESYEVNDPSSGSLPANHPARYHIWSALVPARHVRNADGDLTEWGYAGPDIKDIPHVSEWCSHRARVKPPERREAAIQAEAAMEAPEGHEIWAEPRGVSPVAPYLYHNMSTREPEDWYKGLEYHGPYHIVRHPQTRQTWLVDREGRDANPTGGHYGNRDRDGSYGESVAEGHWHGLESAGPDAHRIGTAEDPKFSVMKERTPAFPHSRVDPEDTARVNRPAARVFAPEGHSPDEEYHGSYEVVRHPETGRYHVVDNQGRYGPMAGWQGHADQLHAERSRDYVERRQQSKEKARGIADALWEGGHNALDPGGTAESRQSEENTATASDMMGRYDGGRGKIKFDPDDEGGRPYYEREHHHDDGCPSGWYARHYGAPFAGVYHRATGDEQHDTIHLPVHPEDTGKMIQRLHPQFGDADLGAALKEWHDQPDGTRRHIETQDPEYDRHARKVQQWKGRHLGVLGAPRDHEPQGISPAEEWHGPYEVVRHPATGRYHVVDNAGREADPDEEGPTWHDHLPPGHPTRESAERARGHIDDRQQRIERSKGLARSFIDFFHNMNDPGGTEEGRQSDRNLSDAQELMTRYDGGRGRIRFDPEEEGGAPFYDREHYLDDGRPSGWYVKHYGGIQAPVHHRATGDQEPWAEIDLPDSGDGTGRHLPAGFGEPDLAARLKAWHDEEGGMRHYYENDKYGRESEPRIHRWRQRHLGSAQAVAEQRRFFHGTSGTHSFEPGDLLTPKGSGRGMSHVYYTSHLPSAARYATWGQPEFPPGHPEHGRGYLDLNADALPGHVYEVQPETAAGKKIGRHAEDPDSGLPGNEDAYRTKGRLRVLHEVDPKTGEPIQQRVASREPVAEVVAHFAAAGPWMQQKLFHVKPDPTLNPPDSKRFNPDDPDQHLRWRAENDEDYQPDECEHCGGDRKMRAEHAERHEDWLRGQKWHTDWDEAELGDTIHRGVTLALPEALHAHVHDQSVPVADRARALVRHIASDPEGLGNFWSDDPDVSKGYAEGKYLPSRRPAGASGWNTPVMLHADIPDRQHIETDPDELEHWGVYSYHDDGNREIPLKREAPVRLTGISWADPDHGEPFHRASTPRFHEDPHWTHHDFGDHGIQTNASLAAEVVAHFAVEAAVPSFTWRGLTYGKGPEGGYVETKREVTGPFYHGSRSKNLKPGASLTKGRKTNPWGDEGEKSQYIHFTTDLGGAREYARQAGGHVYEIEPTGEVRPGYIGAEWKSEHPLRVIRRVEDDESPAQVTAMITTGTVPAELPQSPHPRTDDEMRAHLEGPHRFYAEDVEQDPWEQHYQDHADYEPQDHRHEDFYHGTSLGFPEEEDPPERIVPQGERRFYPGVHSGEHAFATTNKGSAWAYAERAWHWRHSDQPRVLRVRPTGPFEDDPGALMRGGGREHEEGAVQSRHPWAVIGEEGIPEEYRCEREGGDEGYTAALSATASDDDEDPDDYSANDEWDEDAPPDRDEAEPEEEPVAHRNYRLPYMAHLPEGELIDHLHHMHGLDARTSDLYMNAKDRERWHNSEHQYKTNGTHQHDHPQGVPGEEHWPDVFSLSGHTDFAGGTRGDWARLPGNTAPFKPLRSSESVSLPEATASDDGEWEDDEDFGGEPVRLTSMAPERDERDFVWDRLRDEDSGEVFRDPDREPRCLACSSHSGAEERHLPEAGHRYPVVQARQDQQEERRRHWDRGEYDRTRYCGVGCEMSHAEDRAHGIGAHHTFVEGEPEHDEPRLLHGEMPQLSGPHEAPVGRGSGSYEVRDPSAGHRCHYCRSILPQYRRQASLEATAMSFEPTGHFEFYNGEGAEDGRPRTSELENHMWGNDHQHWRRDQDVERARAQAYAGEGTNAQKYRRYHENLSALHQQAHDREVGAAHSAVQHGSDPGYPAEVRQRLESAHEPAWQEEWAERGRQQEAAREHRENGSVRMHGGTVSFDEMESHLQTEHGIPSHGLPEYHVPTYSHHDTYEEALEDAHNESHGDMGSHRHDEGNAYQIHGQYVGSWDAEHHLVGHHGYDINDLRRDEPDLEREHEQNHERDERFLSHPAYARMDEEGHLDVEEGYHDGFDDDGGGGDAFSMKHGYPYMRPPSTQNVRRHLHDMHGVSGELMEPLTDESLEGSHRAKHVQERGHGGHQHEDPDEERHDPVFGSRQSRELVAHFAQPEVVYADVHDQVPALPASTGFFSWPGLPVPEDREQLLETFRDLPQLIGVIREELEKLARRLGDEAPLHPGVVDMIWEMAASCRVACEDMGRLSVASPEGSWEEPGPGPKA
jgi:hypothetical protein